MRVHTLSTNTLARERSRVVLPAKAGKRPKNPLRTSSKVRHIDAREYNNTGQGQQLYDSLENKRGRFATIAPMSKTSKTYLQAIKA